MVWWEINASFLGTGVLPFSEEGRPLNRGFIVHYELALTHEGALGLTGRHGIPYKVAAFDACLGNRQFRREIQMAPHESLAPHWA